MRVERAAITEAEEEVRDSERRTEREAGKMKIAAMVVKAWYPLKKALMELLITSFVIPIVSLCSCLCSKERESENLSGFLGPFEEKGEVDFLRTNLSNVQFISFLG